MRLRTIALISTLVLGLLAASLSAEAQQSKKVPVIGFLRMSGSKDQPSINAFRQGLRDLGYTEGKDIAIEWRFAKKQVDRLPQLAAELVDLKVDVIVAAGGTVLVTAAKNATNVIPIITTTVTDPVAAGFVASLARPGGNITGLTSLSTELVKNRLELLREVVPKLSRLAVLGDRSAGSYAAQMEEVVVAGKALGLQLQPLAVQESAEHLQKALTEEGSEALIVLGGPRIRTRLPVKLAAQSRLPTIYATRSFVRQGGLMSYGPDRVNLYRQAATYVDKILKGAKPADLPIEQPTKFELFVNLKTAKQLGITIPPNILYQATKVIK